jgi:hypothetical protein
VIAGQGIHQGILEGVTHMEGAGHIRRWNHDAVGGTFIAGCEMSLLFPGFIPVLLNGVGVVSLIHVTGFSDWLKRGGKNGGLFYHFVVGFGLSLKD